MYKYVIFSHRTLISHSGVLTYMYTDEVWELEFLIYDFIYLKFKTIFAFKYFWYTQYIKEKHVFIKSSVSLLTTCGNHLWSYKNYDVQV